MAQFYPAGRTGEFPEIDRHPYREELDRAYEIAERARAQETRPAQQGAVGEAGRIPGARLNT